MLQTTPTDPAALARRPDTAGPLAVATPTTRKLADASISVNTRRAYAGALRRLDAWRGAAPVDDASLAVYLGELFEAGRAPATVAVAAVRFRAKLAGQPAPAGEATARVLGGYRRTAADRGRGQAAPLRADGLAAILATTERPRTDGRGVESHNHGAPPGPTRRRDRRLAVHGRAAAVGSRRLALGRRDGRPRRRRRAAHRADLENKSRGGRRRRALSEERRREGDPHPSRRRRRPPRAERGAADPATSAVDEKAFRKGHRYHTIVCDLQRATVECVAEDRKTESLAAYDAPLTDAQRRALHAVAMDMWEAYIGATRDGLPAGDEKIGFDRFHIMRPEPGQFLAILGRGSLTCQRASAAMGIATLGGASRLGALRLGQMDVAVGYECYPRAEAQPNRRSYLRNGG